jgi:lysophospholipase L1-like esterase
MAAQRPQALLLLEGINDLNNDQSVAATVGYLQQMVELARLYNTTVFIGTMFQTCVSTSPSGQVRPNAATRINGFNSALRAMAAGRQNVHVVDLFAAFGTQNCGPDGGIGILGGDGLHPNPSGYSIIATQFAAAVRNVFAVRGSYQ